MACFEGLDDLDRGRGVPNATNTDDHSPNPGTSNPLDAGIAENIISTAPGIELPEADFAVPVYQPPGRRAAASFIFLTITLDMLALGMIAPVLPRLIAGFMAGNASGAARMLGYFGTVFAVMNFFFSPVLRSSRMPTSTSFLIRASTMWLPMNPAPPVTRTFENFIFEFWTAAAVLIMVLHHETQTRMSINDLD